MVLLCGMHTTMDFWITVCTLKTTNSNKACGPISVLKSEVFSTNWALTTVRWPVFSLFLSLSAIFIVVCLLVPKWRPLAVRAIEERDLLRFYERSFACERTIFHNSGYLLFGRLHPLAADSNGPTKLNLFPIMSFSHQYFFVSTGVYECTMHACMFALACAWYIVCVCVLEHTIKFVFMISLENKAIISIENSA